MLMDFFKLETELNTMPMLEETLAVPWNINNARNMISAQKNTDSITLVKGISEPDKSLNDSNLVYPDPIIERFQMTQNFLAWFRAKYGGHFARSMIVRLPVNKAVYRHTDHGDYYKDKDRFHLVLCGGCTMEVDGVDSDMTQGDLIWFNNKKPHSVINKTDTDRIALIFDVYGSKWREMVNTDSTVE